MHTVFVSYYYNISFVRLVVLLFGDNKNCSEAASRNSVLVIHYTTNEVLKTCAQDFRELVSIFNTAQLHFPTMLPIASLKPVA